MKYSISNIAWKPHHNIEVANILKDGGIKHIDVAPLLAVSSLESSYDSQLEDFINFWDEYGISPFAMQSLFYEKKEINFFDSFINVDKMLDYFDAVTSMAKKMSVKSMCLGCPKQRSHDANIVDPNLVRDFFINLASICASKELILCLEPNSTVYGCNFLTNTDDTASFIRSISMDNLKLNFDTSTILLNDADPGVMFEKHNDIIGHVHISRPYLKPVTRETFNHQELASMIGHSNYDEGITIEMLYSGANLHKDLAEAIFVLKNFYSTL